jgi:sugar (pentulose or hexulose) kinase
MAIVVFDVGKTNVKLSLVEAGAIRHTISAANHPLPGPPYPRIDTTAIWSFLTTGLAELARLAPITDIVPVAHGGGAALVDADGELVLPMLDYETLLEDDDYDGIAAPFAETFSPKLPGGLNVARQLRWLARHFPSQFAAARRLLLYPQYWSFRLSGIASSELTYLACHNGLWRPATGGFSSFVDRMGWHSLFPPLRPAGEAAGTILPAVCAATRLSPACRVRVGIHDSSASFLRHRLARPSPFTVASTGTWIVSMAAGGRVEGLPENRNCLVNLDALGAPVPCCLHMGGREYAQLTEGLGDVRPSVADAAAVLARGTMLVPPIGDTGGPFQGCPLGGPRGAAPAGNTETAARASLYLALMTDYCFDLLEAKGPIIVEGSLIANELFLAALAALRRPEPLYVSSDPTGTVSGAAELAGERIADSPRLMPPLDLPLEDYRHAWRKALPE